MNDSTPKRAAIYCRVSTPGQEQEGTSLQTQEEACRKYAAEHGFTIDEAHVYREVHTGTELWERPQLTQLREAVRRKAVDVVVAFAIDRLARDPVHLGLILSEADHTAVPVYFVTEPLDNSPEGQLIRFVRGYAAKVEHLKIVERVTRGKAAHAANGGLIHSRTALYGYSWADDKKTRYVVNPATVPTVIRIFRDYIAGQTLRGIAAGLTAEGIPSPRSGGPWDYTSVRRILTDPQYTGQATAFRTKSRKENGKVVKEKVRPEEWVRLPDGVIPALIDALDFEAARARLRLNRERSARNNSHPDKYLLRGGIVRCGYCGSAMIVVQKSADYAVYACPKARHTIGQCGAHCVPTHNLDPVVWQQAVKVLTDPTVIQRELERTNDDDASPDADLAMIDRALGQTSKSQTRLARAIALLEEADAEPLVREMAQLGGRNRQLQAEREAVLQRQACRELARKRLWDVQEWCAKVAAGLGNMSYQQKRLALDALGVEVRVFRADHEPRYVITAEIPLADAPGDDVVLTPIIGKSVTRLA